MRMFNLLYLMALLSTCTAGFIVPSVRKAIARGYGFPQINKNNQQHHAKGWYHQLIDMNSYGLKGDIGSLPNSNDLSKLNYKPHYAAESSTLHGSNQYHPQKHHVPKASALQGDSDLSVHQLNDRKFGSYHHNNNILDNSLSQTTDNKVALYSTSSSPLSSSPNSSHNIAPVGALKACKRKNLKSKSFF